MADEVARLRADLNPLPRAVSPERRGQTRSAASSRLLIRAAGQPGLADSVLVIATVDGGTIRLWDQVDFGEHRFGRIVEIAAYGHIFQQGDHGHTYELTLTGIQPQDIDDNKGRLVDVFPGEIESSDEEPLPGFQ